MHPTIELMRDQVRAIYRALTGTDLPEGDLSPPGRDVEMEEVARRFVDLEAMARRIPIVMERVPPFSFAPPVDAMDTGHEIVIEVAVPGIGEGEVEVRRSGDLLSISGVRSGAPASNGRTWFLAEIPRGPFHRAIRLPYPIQAEPRVEVDNGIVRIHLARTPVGPAQA